MPRAYVIVDREGNPVPVERTGPHTSEVWLHRQYPNREPLPPGRLLGPRDPHPTCVTERGRVQRMYYRLNARDFARTGRKHWIDHALDNLCEWIEAEEDARVARERIRPARSAEPREPFEPVKPTPRWRAWLARVWPWWG